MLAPYNLIKIQKGCCEWPERNRRKR